MQKSKEALLAHVKHMLTRLKTGEQLPQEEPFAELFIAGDPPATAFERVVPPSESESARRSLFAEMRGMGYAAMDRYGRNNPHDLKHQASIFYLQAQLLVDCTDDFAEDVPFKMYFPLYQKMTNAQLRCYFTWRSKARNGTAPPIDSSYVFLYIYELLHGIGVADALEGITKILSLWQTQREYDPKIDRYLQLWVKDYFIVKDLPCTQKELLRDFPALQEALPPQAAVSLFAVYSGISDYKYEKSVFYKGEFVSTLENCFSHVIAALRKCTPGFDSILFLNEWGGLWHPFRRAIYHQNCDHISLGKTVKISEGEIYHFSRRGWQCSENRMERKNGRRIVGYIIRRIEQFYRTQASFRSKITTPRDKIDCTEIEKHSPGREAFFTCIDTAIADFQRASQHITVKIDFAQLQMIRANALITQEKLTVAAPEPTPVFAAPIEIPAPRSADGSPWQTFVNRLLPHERQAVLLLLQGAALPAFRVCAKEAGVMLEVLVDTINEKALDTVSDTICELSDTVTLFAEYKDEIERVI